MKRFTWILAALLVLLSSCSESDYLNAIPRESTALIAFDVQDMPLLRSVHGIDIRDKVYLFEAPDGNLGLCAAVSNQDNVGQWLDDLVRKGVCSAFEEYKGYRFAIYKNSWVVGFGGKALLMMGPAVGGAQAELRQQMAKYLSQDEDMGIKDSPMFGKLDSINSRIALVAQAQALPEKFIAPFMLGAPQDADASQVVIAAEVKVKDGALRIKGETFSFNKRINTALKEAQKVYRPIAGSYGNMLEKGGVLTLLMNVDGKQFLPLIQQNKGLQALLMGLNTAIDMDNILRAVDGDMTITVNSVGDSGLSMGMGAVLSNYRFMDDVDYWKQSCPTGARIIDWQHNGIRQSGHRAYQYTDGKNNFYFGVAPTAPAVFYSGTDTETALRMLTLASDDKVTSVAGEKLMMTIHLSGMTGEQAETVAAVAGMLKPLFGDVSSIVYTLK